MKRSAGKDTRDAQWKEKDHLVYVQGYIERSLFSIIQIQIVAYMTIGVDYRTGLYSQSDSELLLS
jgi:hypothetical protein